MFGIPPVAAGCWLACRLDASLGVDTFPEREISLSGILGVIPTEPTVIGK